MLTNDLFKRDGTLKKSLCQRKIKKLMGMKK